MSLYKRGGIWWYKFKFQGQPIRESSNSGSRTIARGAEHARRRELETAVNRIPRRDPMPLFRVAAQSWLAEKVGLSQKTVLGYQQRTAPLREEFGDRLVCDLTRDDVLSYRAKRLAAKKSPRTVNYEICCLRGILDGYGLWGAVSRKLSHLKENHNIGQAISADDEHKLLIACSRSLSPSLFTLFILAIDTGLRASELRALRCKDLTMTWSAGPIGCGELVVPKSKTEAGKGRSIPLTQRGCAILSNWLARFPAATADQFVFPRHSVRMVSGGKESIICAVVPGEQVQSWQRAWRKVLQDADLKYRWHDLRHTFITRLAENPNISEETIRALAGHVSKEMLQRYSHIRVAAKRDAIAALERDRLHNSPAGGTELGTIREHSSNGPPQVAEKIWLPPRDSNPDMLIQSHKTTVTTICKGKTQ